MFKIRAIVYKCVHATVPSSLAEMCTPVAVTLVAIQQHVVICWCLDRER